MMKSLKGLTVVLTLSIALFACSEGNYTPTTTPYGVTGNQTGLYNNNNPMVPGSNQFFNPYLANPQYNQMSAQAQFRIQTQSQNMFSCAARATPYFYAFTSSNSNCAVRRQPTYTPSSCACYQAPCNCAQVITQAQSQCGTLYSSDHNGNRVGTVSVGSSNSGSGTVSTSSASDGINAESSTSLLTITNEDAAALYNRLAKTPEETNNSTKTKIRTGSNYKCMMDNKGRHASDFSCDIDIASVDGTVYQQYPVGQTGVSTLQNPELYNGKNVQVGGPGLNPDEGVIKVQGRPAEKLFAKLSAAVTDGTIDLEQRVSAKVKQGKQVKCYQTVNTTSPVTECQVKVNTVTGEAENAS
jgi:hypothetical protein